MRRKVNAISHGLGTRTEESIAEGVGRKGTIELGATVKSERFLQNYRTADLLTPDNWRTWYECYHCKGFIEGHPNNYSVNTMNSHRLSGRNGRETHCIRCGEQIAFVGMMS